VQALQAVTAAQARLVAALILTVHPAAAVEAVASLAVLAAAAVLQEL
jgi:hypothetical protein